MTEAFIYINTHRPVEGKLDEYREFAERMVAQVKQYEPDMMHFGVFYDEERGEVTISQMHRNVENFAFHMQLVAELMAEARELIDFSRTTTQIYGVPTDAILMRMQQMAGPGTEVSVSHPMAAFDRFV